MDKVIIVTGSSTGFGAAMVKTFSAAGQRVIATMRHTDQRNKQTAQDLEKLPNVEVVDLDVEEDQSVSNAVAYIYANYGKVDVLINNAGVYGAGLLEGYSIDQFQKLMDVNVYGILRLYQHVLPHMRAAGEGLIINISSGLGRISTPYQVPYNTSKFAVESITEGGYIELIRHGIETVLIEPGAFMTELFQKEGVHADRSLIQEAYGSETAAHMAGLQNSYIAALMKHQPSLQLVADAALRLVRMEPGKRPLRTTVDPIAEGVDEEYTAVTAEIAGRWIKQYFK
jgi:NADP-dependent 3-hydroxy acid dehydrogenase YdfG